MKKDLSDFDRWRLEVDNIYDYIPSEFDDFYQSRSDKDLWDSYLTTQLKIMFGGTNDKR